MIKQLMLIFLFMGLDVQAATLLEGYAYANKPIPKANVVIHDAAGHKQQVLTNAQGYYRVDVTNSIPPITLSIDDHLATSVTSQTKRACADICISSFANTLDKNQINTVNLNPFTDYLMSQIALQFGFIGPAQLIDKGLDKPVDVSILTKAYSQFHTLFDKSLTQVGIVADAFDPVQSTQLKMNKLFDLMLSHRAYDSTSGQTSHTVLLDLRFKPISEQSPFDYEQALNQKNEILSAKKRIFILSDSTASNYDAKVYPRMGWGQVFDQFIKPQTNVILINGAQSGRSSRSFYEEGWFDLMIPFMQKGDYLMIAFGHNDEKCDSDLSNKV